MKYRIAAAILMAAALGALAHLSQDSAPNPVAAQPSSSADDASMKTLKID